MIIVAIVILIIVLVIFFIMFRKKTVLDDINIEEDEVTEVVSELDLVKQQYIYDELFLVRRYMLDKCNNVAEIEKYVRDKNKSALTVEYLNRAKTDYIAVAKYLGGRFRQTHGIQYYNIRSMIETFPESKNNRNLLLSILSDNTHREYSPQTLACLYFHII